MAAVLFMVAEKLASLLEFSEFFPTVFSGFRWMETDLRWMETELRRVHELLKEDPGLEMNSKELKKWMTELIHTAQNIEDIVDNFDFNVERRLERKGCMRSAILTVKDKVARYKIVAEVIQAKEKMGRICESMPKKMLDHPNYYQVDGPERTLSKIASRFSLLESPLQLCFLYFSLFPEGFEILKRRLIWLWLALGWLQLLEDEWFYPAKERFKTRAVYVEKLARQDMIQVEYSHLRNDFTVKRIRLESPLWDFAAMKAMQYNLISHNIDNEGPPDSSNARVLALHSCGINNHIFRDLFSLPNLRWLLCFPRLPVIRDEVTFPTSRFKLLRVLDLEDMYFITQLSEEIGELVHRRYLGLRRTGLYSLPNSIGNLKNLQSLDIRGTRVKPIPTAAIQKLKRLRYLYMDMDDGSTDDNDSLDVSSLRSLRVLSVIRAGRWMEKGVGRFLRKLGIYGDPIDYQYVQQPTPSLEMYIAQADVPNTLKNWVELRSLRLGFGFEDIIPERMFQAFPNSGIWFLYLERPLQKLPGRDVLPESLQKLCLKWSLLEQDPMATLERLRHLLVLKLRCGSFLGKKMVCSARGFPKLRFLELNLLDGLEEWTVEEGGMRFNIWSSAFAID